MKFDVYPASGRATCQVCQERIKKGEPQLNATHGVGMYTVSGNAHLSCIEKQANAITFSVGGST